MPSKTFLNLPEEKRKKLINAAIEEFSNISYIDVSINKIINKIGIPRGSFYMYFDGKEDLFEYILYSFREKLIKIIRKTFILNNGDIRNSFIHLYDDVSKTIKNNNYKIFFKNFFVFLNTKEDKIPNPNKFIFNNVKDVIKIDVIEDDLGFIFDIFLHNLFTSIVDSLKNKDSKNNKDNYLRKVDILCYGIYKERKK